MRLATKLLEIKYVVVTFLRDFLFHLKFYLFILWLSKQRTKYVQDFDEICMFLLRNFIKFVRKCHEFSYVYMCSWIYDINQWGIIEWFLNVFYCFFVCVYIFIFACLLVWSELCCFFFIVIKSWINFTLF